MTGRLLTITDAWHPQINGVVESIRHTNEALNRRGYETGVIDPSVFRTMAMPGYAEIRLALAPRAKITRMMAEWLSVDSTQIHIATEGPLGWAARQFCVRNKLGFTTAYHTKFPEYLALRAPVPLRFSYAVMRHFHRPAHRVLVATRTLEQTLSAHKFTNMGFWGRGVDTALFSPRPLVDQGLPRPIHLYVGRVAVEKNLDAFLRLSLPGTKMVVGDGPDLEHFRGRYPDCHFMGAHKGAALAAFYAQADVFVFPSRTDTFGLVLLEALASGVPVAAYPVTGPIDVFGTNPIAALDENLEQAITRAYRIDRTLCRHFALEHSWDRATDAFLAHQTAPVSLRT